MTFVHVTPAPLTVADRHFARSRLSPAGWLDLAAASLRSDDCLADETVARGIALERLAAALAGGSERDIGTARAVLIQAADAWQEVVGGDPTQTPFETLNWLRAAWLGGRIGDERCPAAADLARRCGACFRRRFVVRRDAADALLGAEAALTGWLLAGMLPAAGNGDPVAVLGLLFDEALAVADAARPRPSATATIERLRVIEHCLPGEQMAGKASVVRALRARAESYFR